jgi:hypothetical protein
MSVLNPNQGIGLAVLGVSVSKSTGTLAATTVPLFTISGIVAVTSLIGEVTTAVTVANSYKLQHNPTVGATKDIAAALDIGTIDSPVGEIFTAELDLSALVLGGAPALGGVLFLSTGQIEHVSAGTDGVILWRLTYAPVSTGASVAAA